MWRVVGLIFVAYPLLRIASTPTEPVVALAALAATACFAILTLSLGRRTPDDPRRADLRLAALDVAITALAAFAVLRSPDEGWIALFYYASTAASLLLPDRRALTLIAIAGIVAGICLLGFGDGPSALVQGLAVSIIGVTVFAMAALRRTNARLYAARRELAQLAVAAERDRIARDLHDTLGHSLSLIAIKSELAGRLLPDDPERARAEVADVERVARDSLASIRATVRGDVRPTREAELANARVALEAAGIEPAIEDRAGDLPEPIESVVAWVIREAATNVVRHSGASHASITTEQLSGTVRVEVVDDGVGGRADDGSGTGLAGLHERLAAVDGALEAGPGPGGGYRVVTTIPLTDPSTPADATPRSGSAQAPAMTPRP
jgi:two-component system sensor histidine kinase DesK